MFVHNVFFWLKPDIAPAAKAQLLADCKELLAKIPGVRKIWAGPPAGTPREVVDNSYGVGLTIVFDDVAGHDVYQPHPLHQEFIARNKAGWAKVTIYDFVE